MAAQKKSPSVAAHGATEKQTREMLCAATLPATHVGRQCSSCGYFRTPSAGFRTHSFCQFTGERAHPDDSACFAWPGLSHGGAA